MIQENLREILNKHIKWLNEEDDGERADLSGADLRYADLFGADLRGADLFGANLEGATLCSSNLRSANLHYANLRNSSLYGADLCGANLSDANLRGADLSYANLSGAILRYANLSYVDLNGADLRSTDLSSADLTNAVYTGTILNLQCSEEGSFIAWKKLADDAIAKLLIPEDAKRSSATTRKCRASKAEVLAIYSKNGEEVSEGRSRRSSQFIYRVGKTVYPDSWDEDRWDECSNGIHFFITRKEAEEY